MQQTLDAALDAIEFAGYDSTLRATRNTVDAPDEERAGKYLCRVWKAEHGVIDYLGIAYGPTRRVAANNALLLLSEKGVL